MNDLDGQSNDENFLKIGIKKPELMAVFNVRKPSTTPARGSAESSLYDRTASMADVQDLPVTYDGGTRQKCGGHV